MVPARMSRWAAVAAIVGGLLWSVYSVFEMLAPWGAASVYQEELGYDRVTNIQLFRAYTLPGGVAISLIAYGLLGVSGRWKLPMSQLGKLGVVLTYVASGLAILSTVGVLILVAPVAIGGVMFGSLALGAAIFLLALDARRARVAATWKMVLLALGVLGLLLLPLRPLVWAFQVLPAGVAATVMAVFGLGWLVMGVKLWLDTDERFTASTS